MQDKLEMNAAETYDNVADIPQKEGHILFNAGHAVDLMKILGEKDWPQYQVSGSLSAGSYYEVSVDELVELIGHKNQALKAVCANLNEEIRNVESLLQTARDKDKEQLQAYLSQLVKTTNTFLSQVYKLGIGFDGESKKALLNLRVAMVSSAKK